MHSHNIHTLYHTYHYHYHYYYYYYYGLPFLETETIAATSLKVTTTIQAVVTAEVRLQSCNVALVASLQVRLFCLFFFGLSFSSLLASALN